MYSLFSSQLYHFNILTMRIVIIVIQLKRHYITNDRMIILRIT